MNTTTRPLADDLSTLGKAFDALIVDEMESWPDDHTARLTMYPADLDRLEARS